MLIYPSDLATHAKEASKKLHIENIDLPKIDFIIGGPPCQSFSLVGKRSKNDERGTLVFKYLEIIQEKRPKAFVMENVPGMAASKYNGVRLTVFLEKKFTALGYKVTILKLDASEYLVPQKRKRIFIIGTPRKQFIKPDSVFFAKQVHNLSYSKFDIGAKSAIGDLGKVVELGKLASYNRSKPSLFAELMRDKETKRVSLHEIPTMSEKDKELISFIPPGGNYLNVPDEFATQRILNFKKTGGRTTAYARLHKDNPSYTVNTQFRRPNVGSNIHYKKSRLISAREAMRFQSIPDRITINNITKTDRNILIGNAVPYLLAQSIAFNLLKYI